MKVTHNEDGTVTVRIPKSPEVYEATDGGLYIEETLDKEDFKDALKAKKADKDEEPKA